MAVETETQLETRITTNVADNSAGDISADDIRVILLNLVDSLAFRTAVTAAAIKTLYEGNADTNAFTSLLRTKLTDVEDDATADQDGAEIVALLQALTGNARLQASAVRLLAGAIDTELGSAAWRTGGGGTVDGVLSALALADDGEVSATITGGADFTADFATGINALIALRVATANPLGTDGVPLNRITIRGLNYNISGGGVMPTHTEQYLAGKATQNFGPGDFTGGQGVAYPDASHTATMPTVMGNVFAAVARISTDPEPTFADVNSQGINQFSDFTKQAAEIAIDSDMYEVWVSDYAVFSTGDMVEFR